MIFPITKLQLGKDTQSRVELNNDTVDDYVELMLNGTVFPPITVFYDGNNYWLADGFHRVDAALNAEISELDADIIEGSKRDAVLYSVGCNANHGLRRSNADKRRAVMMLLGDNEWVQWSDREIARQCKVDHKTVSRLRNALDVTGEFPSENQSCPTERTYVNKQGQTTTMNTDNIGRSLKPLEIPEASSSSADFTETQQSYERPTYEPPTEDIVLSNEYFANDIIPKKMMANLDSLNKMCEEKIVNTWSPADKACVRTKLNMLKSRIEYLLLNIG